MVTVERTLRTLAGVIISDSWHAPVFLCQSVLIFVSPAGSTVSEAPEPVGAADRAAAVSHMLPPQLWGSTQPGACRGGGSGGAAGGCGGLTPPPHGHSSV